MRVLKSYLISISLEAPLSYLGEVPSQHPHLSLLRVPQSYFDSVFLLSTPRLALEVPESYVVPVLAMCLIAGMAVQEKIGTFREESPEPDTESQSSDDSSETADVDDESSSHPSTRAAIYARVSSPEQVKNGNSLKEQVRNLRAIATERDLSLVTEPIKDGGETGTDFDRPGIQEVARLASQGEIDCVLVDDVDRIGRHPAETIFYFYELREECGVTVITAESGELDVNTFQGLVEVMMKSLSAQLANQNRARRAHASSIQKFEEKNWSVFFNEAPLGYEHTSEDWLKINPDEVVTVRNIFETFLRLDLNGAYRATAKQVDGVPDSMQSYQMKRILRDRIYVGEATVNSEKEGADGTIPKVGVKDESLKIIDSDVFERTQEKITRVSNRYSKGDSAPDDVEDLVEEFGTLIVSESSPVVNLGCPECDSKLVKNGQRKLNERRVHNYLCTNTECGLQRKFPTTAELERMVDEAT